jgi:dolichol-phosphate mannosyltransferase
VTGPIPQAGPEVSVIVPTFNERENIAELTMRVGAALRGRAWEIIYVDDDSPDGTAAFAANLPLGIPACVVSNG